MPLILHGVTPIHWSVAGALVAGITLALLFVTNRRLGISSTFDDLCSLALPQPYFQRKSVLAGRVWRMPFAAGLLLGGFLSAVLGGGWSPMWALGLFDERIGFGVAGKVAWMFVGGLFVGFGTRLANGCTSGHGIFGTSHLERASILSTIAFMASGILTTHFVYRVLFP